MTPARTPIRAASILLAAACWAQLPAQRADTLHAAGLREPVEILRDRSGINHIYARNEHDLFFAQGYAAAHDRLFQLEMWRRQATGTVAELLGRRELERDVGARLFKYRGDLTRELAHYHPHGASIVAAFVDGVNAYVAETERHPELLPIEFHILGTKPGRWTPDVVISRHQGLLGNVEDELNYGRAVAAVGPATVKRLAYFQPGDPDIRLDSAIDGALLSAPILAKYQAFHSPLRFRAGATRSGSTEGSGAPEPTLELDAPKRVDIGSNNWAVSGRLSASGLPLLANDPHRAQSVPSLRYWVHLVAPGWNVVGGGEPEIPGVSIGHNEFGAWGLTVFETDGEDLYVYKTNPANAREYWYRGHWEPMRVIRESIPIKGEAPITVDLAYTRHGPVVYEDSAHHAAYAVRAAWLEPGGAPYMASLRMDQARSWEEFRDACAFSNIPGENMVWADRAGNIGWQAVGIAPIRRTWSGLVPVPGDGRYEWAGFLPIKEKPHSENPASGFIATANNNLIPNSYAHMDAVGFEWADPFRWRRITEVLSASRQLTVNDMARLQTDYTSIPAGELVPLLRRVRASNAAVEQARETVLSWNYVLDTSSVAAGIYEAWFRRLNANVRDIVVPRAAQPFFRSLSAMRLIEWLRNPGPSFGANPAVARDSLVLRSLREGVAELTRRFGASQAAWRWGQPAYHHITITHALSPLADSATRARLDVGPAPRGGDAYTPGATGGGDNQTSGASFRILVDVADWEKTLGINSPGQLGDPNDPHYRDLFPLWATDRYFVVPFARARVEAVAERRVVLLGR